MKRTGTRGLAALALSGMKKTGVTLGAVVLAGATLALPAAAQIQQEGDSSYDAREACAGLPTHFELKQALIAARGQVSAQTNGGLGNHMWASIVNRDGIVCPPRPASAAASPPPTGRSPTVPAPGKASGSRSSAPAGWGSAR